MVKSLFKNATKHSFVRYAIIGLGNTAIDFALLFLLIKLTGITEGTNLFLLNILTFSIATANSYLFNKYWTFQDKATTGQATKFSQFFIISIIGALINSGIVVIFTSSIDPVMGISAQYWAMIGKVLATSISLIWNFVGYKYFVFKKKTTESKE